MRLRAILTISAIGTMAACFMFLLGSSTSEPEGPISTVNGIRYAVIAIDGCEYVQNLDDGQLVHAGNCINPVHWQGVISDTSWHWRVRARRDARLRGLRLEE